MRKNLLIAAVGAFLGALFTYFVKDDQIIRLRLRHRVELNDERDRSFKAGWDGSQENFDSWHPHLYCKTCFPPSI